MKTKLLPGLLLFCLFIACKKDKKPAPVIYSVSGYTFTLATYQTNFGIGVNADVNQYPCMAYNTLTFYRDSTASSNYFGLDSCFITPTHLSSAGAQEYGLPGTLPLAATWRQNGNNIYVTYAGDSQPAPGVVSSVNGKLQILFKNNVQSGGKSYFINSLQVQQ